MHGMLFLALRLTAIALLLACVAPAHAVSAPETPPDPRFGIVESFVNPAAASEAGAGATRIILRWDVIQPGGPADWKPANVPDPLLAGELAAGREVIGLLIGTPDWAAAAGQQPGSRAVPDMDAWAAFTRRMAQHYQGRIRHWVIWNEPDVWMEGHPGRTWDGTVEDYEQLLETAYGAIKGVDPSMQVFVAGMTYYWDWERGRRRYLDRLLEAIAADPDAAANGHFFDGVVYHLYFTPRQTVDVLAETRQSLARYGMSGKQIWINETNAPPSDDPQELPWSTPRFPITLEEQAAFIVQQFSLTFAHGASRVQVYKLRNTADHPESIEPFGLLRADDSRRPAFDAFQTATAYLGDFTTAREERQGDITAVTFERGAQTTTVLWVDGTSARSATVQAIAPQALLVDETGQTQTLLAQNGVYTLKLPGAACSSGPPCRIGGAPRLLVEEGAAAGRSALAAIPAPSPAAAARPAPAVQPQPQPSQDRPWRPARPGYLWMQ
ncbi:MAG: hypothetical protein WA040_00285 [Anaerolineae bacterium]